MGYAPTATMVSSMQSKNTTTPMELDSSVAGSGSDTRGVDNRNSTYIHSLSNKSNPNLFPYYYSTTPKEAFHSSIIRISVQLHGGSSDNNRHGNNPPDKYESIPNYLCNAEDNEKRAPLPPSLSHPTILDFTTSISTNLRIVFVEDSVAGQFAQTFDSSTVVPSNAEVKAGEAERPASII